MNHTYVTDKEGNELSTTDRDPRAAFHFIQVGLAQDGIVWRASEISGRSMRHRLTFTSYYTESSAKTWSMGRLLFHEMNQQEQVARWEAGLIARWEANAAAQPHLAHAFA
ncbi:MAG: hypothetical protein RSP_04680 [Rhodanobacter sp.]